MRGVLLNDCYSRRLLMNCSSRLDPKLIQFFVTACLIFAGGPVRADNLFPIRERKPSARSIHSIRS